MFQDDGAVRITSYINNLHPTKYASIYQTIEKLIETSLPLWDQCLTMVSGYKKQDTGPGRTAGRFGIPSDPEYGSINPQDCFDAEVSKEQLENEGWEEDYLDDEDGGQEMLAKCKWKVLRKPRLPEPRFEDVDYEPAAGQRLSDKFLQSGLQVIVKMASIELTPEKPYFHQGSWHVEGQMNEHICATALYYVDSENITTSSLSFRMQTSAYLEDDHPDFRVGQGNFTWMESNYATRFGADSGGTCLQNYGSVETKEKRLLAFPNVFHHRVSPFELADPTKPGHRRFIALWLVDPHKRIISTANVPPQQMSWWAESLLDHMSKPHDESTSELPHELVRLLQENDLQLPSSTDKVWTAEEVITFLRDKLPKDALPMTLEEAKEHRLNLMKERSAFGEISEAYWQTHEYGFCEH
ncbi:hypothetical protein N0V95_003356 [Ascochyta clinopodiicola]|nr:hypothetical protein N0V95_003356 [Ascochyta clinopodiicola]